jgi:hypothetical protein
MRNLQRLAESHELMPSDTIDFLSNVQTTITKLQEDDAIDKPYVKWFCDEVLHHFLKQSNVSTLLYELASQKWQPNSSPERNDYHTLVYLSLAARLFLLLIGRDWKNMKALLLEAGISDSNSR